MTRDLIERLYSINHQVVLRNTEGISHEESVRPPSDGTAGNAANWVLGHIIVHRDKVLELLGAPAGWSAGDAALYERGTTLPASPLPFERLLDDFRDQLQRRRDRLRRSRPALTVPE